MVGIEFDPLFTQVFVFFFNQLQTVVVDEDVCCAALQLVRADCLLKRLDSWGDDAMEALLVYGALDGDVREDPRADPRRRLGGVIL